MICPTCKKKLIEEQISAVMVFLSCLECNEVYDYYKIPGISDLVKNQQDLPPEYSKAVDKHFWELV